MVLSHDQWSKINFPSVEQARCPFPFREGDLLSGNHTPFPFSFREEGELTSGNYPPLLCSFREEGKWAGVWPVHDL
ncbi:MAG: hypothetical protein LBK76_08570 [Verrucomicrobiales bacterium]|jgi:hypothetical protein|nr:hypothetical protein [Verrucomicrobiales bacterium]